MGKRKILLLIESIEKIQRIGNESTHTQNTLSVTDEEFQEAVSSLLNLYSYLFVEYFEKYEFGSNPEVMSAFSILPPIIRYITLKHLYEKYPDNLSL